MSGRRAITRVVLKNYKSIEFCDVELNPLMILVGPNGSGKSNFLDALSFVAETLNSTIDVAIQKRGGIDSILKKNSVRNLVNSANTVYVELHMQLSDHINAMYSFEIKVYPAGSSEINKVESSDKKSCERGPPRAPLSIPGASSHF